MEAKEFISKVFSEFMAKVAKLDELVEVGSKLLVRFRQGLEFIRRPPINKTSDLVEHILRANETKRLLNYVEAGCVKTHDKREYIHKLHVCHRGLHDHLSKAKCIVAELEDIVKKVTNEMPILSETNPRFQNKVDEVEFDLEVTTDDELLQRQSVTDYAFMISIVYSMVKRDFNMQEKIIASLNFKTTTGELESYIVMWPLRPYISEKVMHQAWELLSINK